MWRLAGLALRAAAMTVLLVSGALDVGTSGAGPRPNAVRPYPPLRSPISASIQICMLSTVRFRSGVARHPPLLP
jgi:hypothetical protein